MPKLQRILPVLAALAILNFSLFAASEEDDPKPIPTAVKSEGSMPLALYKSLRAKLMSLSELASAPPAKSDSVEASESEQHAAEPVKAAPNAGQLMLELAQEVKANEASIISALSSPRSIQRELAARVLSMAEDRKAASEALCAVLENDKDADVRTAAAFTLGRLADARAFDALVKGLSDESEAVRTQAVTALGLLRDERAVPELMHILRSGLQPLVRLQAAISLSRIKTNVNATELSDLLDAEADERVKMAIAAAVRVITGTVAPEISEVPEQEDYQKQLTDLSGSMKSVEQKLRDDRHDEVVQVDQKDIDDKLTNMISELEKMAQMKQQQQQQKEKQDSKRRLSMMTGEQQSPSPKPGKAGSKPPPPERAESKLNAGRVVGGNENWAKLPAAERDELLQIFRPEVPLRWRQRLEAYFVSIAAEEAKAQEK
ncbi:MAG TPA: HEAT repeat domain-containing protein [Planctomycetota bacterium]|nr:HEAT repeat domain-containing protein [Planctomycetota bacterium]